MIERVPVRKSIIEGALKDKAKNVPKDISLRIPTISLRGLGKPKQAHAKQAAALENAKLISNLNSCRSCNCCIE